MLIQALPFMAVASQKNFIAVYHMADYSDKKLLDWLTSEYKKHSDRKLDMGKSCVRFKNVEQIPCKLIRVLASKVTPKQWTQIYEQKTKQ